MSLYWWMKTGWNALEKRSGILLPVGLLGVVAINAWQWFKDRKRLEEIWRTSDGEFRPSTTPKVSILLPAWNEACNLDACIQSILSLRYPNKELIVCAGGRDGTWEIARGYADDGVDVLEQASGEGKQGALRRCFERSSGEIIFLTDADCVLDDACFEATLAPVQCGSEQASTGSWRPLDRQVKYPFVQHQWGYHLYREVTTPDYAPTLDGRNAAIGREALINARAFHVPAPIGTDYVLSRQLSAAGFRIRYVRHSRVRTEYPETVHAFANQISRWYRNPLVLGARLGERELLLGHLRAGVASWAMLLTPLTLAWGSRLIWHGWVAAAAYLYLSKVRVAVVAKIRSGVRWSTPWYLINLMGYMVNGWYAMGRGLVEVLQPSRRRKWS